MILTRSRSSFGRVAFAWPSAARYVAALILALATTGMIALINSDWGFLARVTIENPGTVFVATVTLAAVFLGLGPALAAAGASLVAIYLFFTVHESLPRVIVLVATMLVIIALAEWQRRAQAAAAEAQAKVAAILESMNDAVMVVDGAGRATEVNHAAIAMLDASDHADARAKIMYRRADGSPATDEYGLLERALAGEEAPQADVLIPRGTGDPRTVSAVASPIRDARGQTIGAVSVSRDITERLAEARERERLLRQVERERRYSQQVLENVPVGIAVVRADDFTLLSFNGVYEDSIRRAPGAAALTVGASLLDAMPPASHDAATRLLSQARDENRVIRSTAYAAAVVPDEYYDGTIQPLLLADGTDALLITAVNVTERVRAERERATLHREVERQAAQLAATFEAMVDGVAIYDLDGAVIHRNEAFYAILHLEPGMAPPAWEAFIRAMHLRKADGTPMTREDTHSYRALQGETIREEVVLVRDGLGRDRYFRQNASPIRAADGAVIGAVVVFTDVTERLEQEREREELFALIEERRRFTQAIFDTVPVSLAVVDTDALMFETANPAFLDATPEPYCRQGVNRCALTAVLPHAAENGFADQLRAVGSGGAPFRTAATHYAHPQRGTTYWNETIVPLVTSDPAAHHVLYIAADVSEQVEAQQRAAELAETAAQRAAELEAIIANMPDGVAIYAPDGTLLQMNPAGQRSADDYGETPSASFDAAVGRYAFAYPDGRPIPLDDLPLARALRGETVSGYEFVSQTRRGAVYRLASSAPIRNAAGEITSVVVMFSDITERKHAEQERERLLREVEERRHFAQAVIESAPVGIAVCTADEQFTVVLANDQFRAIVGDAWGEPSLIGAPFHAFTPNAERAGILPIFRRVIERGEPVSLSDFEYAGSGGDPSYFDWSLVPLREGGDSVTGLILLVSDVTERVLSRQRIEELADAEALRAAELGAIIENMPIGVAIHAPDGRILHMNSVGKQITRGEASGDASPAEIVEHFQMRDLDGRPIPLDELPLPRALRGETVSDYEFMGRTPHGDGYFLSGSAPIRTAAGEIVSAVVMFTDITERKRAEALTTRFGRILDASANEIYVCDATTLRFSQVNAGARQNLGYTMDELTAMTPLDIKPEFTPESYDALIAPLRSGERGEVTFETVHRRKDGTRYPVEVNLQVSRSENPPVLVAIIQDITERVRARQRIEELAWDAAQRAGELETVIASIADGVMVMDAEGRIVLENAAARALTGRAHAAGAEAWVRPEGLGNPDGTAMLRDELPLIRALGGEIVTDQVLTVRREETGEERFLICSSAPVQAGSGAITGAVAVFRDITEMKQLDQMKDEFISIAAHELRTPLTAIKGYAELLDRRLNVQGGRENDRKSLAVIRKQAERLSGLVNEMLDVSRIEGGRLQLNREPFDLGLLVGEVVSNLRVTSETHILSLAAEPAVAVFADTARIEQVLINLISNATTYSPAGSEIAVRVWAEGETAHISVSDHGVGIAPEELPHLFDRFYRAPSAGAMRSGGMGLGLYICQEIVTRHGGAIQAESAAGAGSTFTVTLPLSREGLRTEW